LQKDSDVPSDQKKTDEHKVQPAVKDKNTIENDFKEFGLDNVSPIDLDKYNDIGLDDSKEKSLKADNEESYDLSDVKMKKPKSKLRKQQDDIINKDKEPKSNSLLMLIYYREC